jgi:hypothetical protein
MAAGRQVIRLLGGLGVVSFHLLVAISLAVFALAPFGHPVATYLLPIAIPLAIACSFGLLFLVAHLLRLPLLDILVQSDGEEDDRLWTIYAVLLLFSAFYFGVVIYLRS